jgi:hypothetical protein
MLMWFGGGGRLRAKRQTRRKWDEDYGRIGREGNMWWLGTVRANWEQVFGPKPWTWLRTSLLFDSIVCSMALLTIQRLKQFRLDQPRDKGRNTLETHALARTGCGCLGNSGRQICSSSDLSGMTIMIFLWIYMVCFLRAWRYWMYTQHVIICRHLLLFALPFRLWPFFRG